MSKESKRNISYTGRIEPRDLMIKEPAREAAGLTGVMATLRHAGKEIGLTNVASVIHMNQKDGFDCPGCAWPDPDKPSRLGEFCENGAKALVEEATHLKVDADFFRKHSVEQLSQCTDFEIGKSGRITHPFYLAPGASHYRPIGWREAFERVAHELHNLDHPDQAIFYTSGRSSNEAAFLYGLFIRAYGTNNMPDCSNMCHESSGVALKETLGIGKGSAKLEDFDQAEVVIVMGQNPGTNHPRMLSALQKCKENGGKILTINPLEEAGLLNFRNPQQVRGYVGKATKLTDIYLQVRINQDIALLKLIMLRLLRLHESGRQDVFDLPFIEKHTSGFAALTSDLRQYNEAGLLRDSGVDTAHVDAAVELLASRSKVIICWAMGLTQHKNGVDNIKECVNLLLLKGSLGKPGTGTCPVRGHSNVQGDRTVGIMHEVSKPYNEALAKEFGFCPPQRSGLDTVGAINAMYEGSAKFFMALGGNFLSAASDTAYTAAALQNCKMTVSVATKLNRTHLVTGQSALLLPTLGRSEKDEQNGKLRYVTVENSMGKVHRSRGIRTPPSEALMSEPQIIAGIAQACFRAGGPQIDWALLGKDYDALRLKMSAVLQGFEAYAERSAGSGFYLPNNVRERDFSMMPEGKARFSVCSLPDHQLKPDEFLLMTVRAHDQFNTTIYGWDDRYRGVFNERRVLFMNLQDMHRLSLKPKEEVDLVSVYHGVERRAACFQIIPYNIPSGNLASYFPETNILVPIDEYATKSRTPISKSIKVMVVKSGQV